MRRDILKYLKELYPNEKWSWEREFGHCSYYTESGWHAHWCSCWAPRFDGDDDNFVSRFYLYFNDGKPAKELYFVKEFDV